MVGLSLLTVPLVALLWFAAPGGAVAGHRDHCYAHRIECPRVVWGGRLWRDVARCCELAGTVACVWFGIVAWKSCLDLCHVGLARLLAEVSSAVGLSAIPNGVDRISVVLVALCMGLGVLPLLRHSKDTPATGLSLWAGLTRGAAQPWHLLRHAELPGNAMLYLLARMLYINGKMALLIFGGVYAAGVMQWSATQLLVLGLIVTMSGVLGGVFGGWLDTLFGPKRAFEIEIAVTLLCAVAQLGVTPDTIFFIWHDMSGIPVLPLPIFNTAPEIVYILIALILNIFDGILGVKPDTDGTACST